MWLFTSGCLLGGVGGLEGWSDALTENPFSILNWEKGKKKKKYEENVKVGLGPGQGPVIFLLNYSWVIAQLFLLVMLGIFYWLPVENCVNLVSATLPCFCCSFFVHYSKALDFLLSHVNRLWS